MTAGYRKSEFQKALDARLATIDTGAPGFLDAAPFVLDCRDDRTGFDAQVTPEQRARLEKHRPATVSALLPGARHYAMAQLRVRFEGLDEDARAKVRAILGHWRVGRGGKPGEGIEIILPGGLRLAYDAADLIGYG